MANILLWITFRTPSRHEPPRDELVSDRDVQLKVVKLAKMLLMLCKRAGSMFCSSIRARPLLRDGFR